MNQPFLCPHCGTLDGPWQSEGAGLKRCFVCNGLSDDDDDGFDQPGDHLKVRKVRKERDEHS